MATPTPSRQVLFGVALVCFANLLLEVVLTRLFSAMMAYHFTFVAVALALFGLGASGVYVYVRPEKFPPERAQAAMAQYARRFGGATILALVYLLANPLDVLFVPGTGRVPLLGARTLWQLVLLSGFCALPFFCAGMVVALAVTHYRSSIHRLYFYDLAGAALAALSAGLALAALGAPSLALAVAVCALAGAALLERPHGLELAPLVGAATLFALNLGFAILAVPTVKGVRAETTRFEEWNAFSRVTVDDQNWIKIDSNAATPIVSAEALPRLNWRAEISALAYALPERGAASVLIIGPGGGRDVAHALAAGARSVTGVELNPIIARTIMDRRFLVQSGGLYRDPRVAIRVDEGRSFVRRSHERYDVIQASLVDTAAATAAGAFALTENTLYTLEAFGDYLSHLSDQGVLTMTRWHGLGDAESERLVLLAAAALERRGVPPARARGYLYFAVYPQAAQGTLLVKRTPFAPAELARLDAACQKAKFLVLLSPTTPGLDPLEKLVQAGAFSELARKHRQELSPPTDDRPFFFYFAKPAELARFTQWLRPGTPLDRPALWILVAFGSSLAVLALGFIVIPLVVHRAAALRGGGAHAAWRRLLALGYFVLIGLGFIVVEIALLQKFTFFLGHPTYSLLVVLFSLLVATACGAALAGRPWAPAPARAAFAAGLAVAVLCGLYGALLGPLLGVLVGWPLPARIALSMALVGCCGLVMGVMLPSGVRLLEGRDAEVIPWGWGLNGAASVIGTVGATVLALHAGFAATFLCGAGCYLLAGPAAAVLGRLLAPRS